MTVFKKFLAFMVAAIAVAAVVLVVLDREERRLLTLYRQVEDRLGLKKNSMTVEF